MFSKLLKSTARRRLFQIFIEDSRQKYYLRQLAEHLDYSPGSLQRELNGLVGDGYLSTERVGNMKFFTLNKKHPFMGELKKYLEEHPQAEEAQKRVIKRKKTVFQEAQKPEKMEKKSVPVRLEIQ